MTTLHYYPCWILIHPAPDIDGCWIAHCLEFDVISQGESPRQAFERVLEATAMVLMDDRAAGLDPEERRAPDACWETLARVLESGTRLVDDDPLEDDRVDLGGQRVTIATQVTAAVESHEVQPTVKPDRNVPWFLLARPKTEPAHC